MTDIFGSCTRKSGANRAMSLPLSQHIRGSARTYIRKRTSLFGDSQRVVGGRDADARCVAAKQEQEGEPDSNWYLMRPHKPCCSSS